MPILQNIYDKHLGAEFRNEVETLAKIEHLNLVRFYGFLEQEDEKIIVVEYVSNGTLREHLDCEIISLLPYSLICIIFSFPSILYSPLDFDVL